MKENYESYFAAHFVEMLFASCFFFQLEGATHLHVCPFQSLMQPKAVPGPNHYFHKVRM